jgi:glucose/mannose-6-phosphate isomerase
MRSLATELPNQLLTGFRAARDLAPAPRVARHAVVVGMGGSAIAADLAATLTDPETELTLGVTRGPSLPRSVGSDGWAIFASYSGQTWETLSSYDEARRRGCARLAISSGGELAVRAERDGVPHLMLPPGLPPRAALGYMLGGLLGALDPFFPESNDRRLRQATDRLGRLGGRLSDPKGPAAEIAAQFNGRSPVIYADGSFAGLARRWKTQIEENAKTLAHFDVVPELFHNALVAWDAISPKEARRRAVAMLEWSEESPAARWGFQYLRKVLAQKGVRVVPVPLASTDRLEALLEGVALGDHVSLFMAAQSGIDPLPVEAITRLKKAQESQSPTRKRIGPTRTRSRSG